MTMAAIRGHTYSWDCSLSAFFALVVAVVLLAGEDGALVHGFLDSQLSSILTVFYWLLPFNYLIDGVITYYCVNTRLE